MYNARQLEALIISKPCACDLESPKTYIHTTTAVEATTNWDICFTLSFIYIRHYSFNDQLLLEIWSGAACEIMNQHLIHKLENMCNSVVFVIKPCANLQITLAFWRLWSPRAPKEMRLTVQVSSLIDGANSLYSFGYIHQTHTVATS